MNVKQSERTQNQEGDCSFIWVMLQKAGWGQRLFEKAILSLRKGGGHRVTEQKKLHSALDGSL